MSDCIGILINAVILAIALLIMYFVEINLRRARRERFKFLLAISGKFIVDTSKDENYPRYDDESMRVIDVLESLQPFDYVNRDCVSFNTKSSDGILEYRDALKKKYHGIQGCQLIRQRRFVSIVKDQSCNMFPEWTDIGPVKKGGSHD